MPQGGTLSQPLFQSTLVELEAELQAAGCGTVIAGSDGNELRVACIAYVDDVVLLAKDIEGLRRAVKIACGRPG